ncbi:hypothetical protein ACHAWF_010658, partial [Thalassiosira exigua]
MIDPRDRRLLRLRLALLAAAMASLRTAALARRLPLATCAPAARSSALATARGRDAARRRIAFQSTAASTRCATRTPLPLRASVSRYDSDSDLGGHDDASGSSSPSSLPYSTTASTPAPQQSSLRDGSLASKSSLPFSAPRTSFDDSLPSALEGASRINSDGSARKGYLEWSKLGLLTELVDAVTGDESSRSGLGLVDGPTPVQSMAIPDILAGCKDRMASAENVRPEGGAGAEKRSAPKSSFDVDLSDSPQPSTAPEAGVIPPARSLAFAAATGSGKTLAYLLPVVQSLRAQEMMTANLGSPALAAEALARLRRPRRPRALVLAPTRELARQILGVLKSVGHHCKISSELLVGGDGYGKQRKRTAGRAVDVLVATPGRLVKHRDQGDVFLGSVRHVVIDEMDTMLEQGFQNDLGELLHPMLYRKKVVAMEEYKSGKLDLAEGAPQVILTTATMTPAVRRFLDKPELPFEPKRIYGKQRGALEGEEDEETSDPDAVKIALPRDIRVLTAPGLHRVVPRLKQVFVNVGGSDKLSLLVDVVSGGERRKRERRENKGEGVGLPLTLVFCNTVASCRAAEHALAESGVGSLCYHGDLGSADREENLKAFRSAGEGGGEASVLVCTDVASRGLDVPQVDHVVMFDFPLNPIDYLHRA